MIDPNEAPEGCVAVPAPVEDGIWVSCKECDLSKTPECLDAHCLPFQRKDGQPVNFKRIGPVMAVYSTPCDDMGAHVADDEVTA